VSGAHAPAPVVELTGVVKSYRGLRPLRMASLALSAGERVAITGLDAGAAEVLVSLVTGAGLPDAGEVRVFGRPTSSISEGDEWLSSLDRFGIVSPRAVLLEGASVQQNLAVPFTLDIDPVPSDVAVRISELAVACGLPADAAFLAQRAGDLAPEMRARIHLARAIALAPDLLLLEHPTAGIPDRARAALSDDVARVAEARRLTSLLLTQDDRFARRVAHRVLQLQPATGALKPLGRGWSLWSF
jgi:ABC-type transporter Mla maintaining outer membrane lipid asymmetry ATPase subunit MlaF